MKPDSTASREMIRFSIGVANTMEEMKTAVSLLQKFVVALRA